MYRKIFLVIGLAMLVSACGGGETSKVVKSMQRSDKNLSCKEILLEMNEADFYREMAHKNRGVKLKNVLMPLGYISTYMDAEEAIEAAEARVSYLDKVYEILRCDEKEREMESVPVYRGPQSSYQGGEIYMAY